MASRRRPECMCTDRRQRTDGRRSKRNISLFIAMSLDGYIADGQGGADRLQGQGNDDEMVDSY